MPVNPVRRFVDEHTIFSSAGLAGRAVGLAVGGRPSELLRPTLTTHDYFHPLREHQRGSGDTRPERYSEGHLGMSRAAGRRQWGAARSDRVGWEWRDGYFSAAPLPAIRADACPQ